MNQYVFNSSSADDQIKEQENKINEYQKLFENIQFSEGGSQLSYKDSFLSSTQDDLLVKSHKILSRYTH